MKDDVAIVNANIEVPSAREHFADVCCLPVSKLSLCRDIALADLAFHIPIE